MEGLWPQDGVLIPKLTIDMARYFARFSPADKQSDYYTRLLKGLVQLDFLECTSFATLNYECLIELAAANLGIATTYAGRRRDGSISLWKLHGSCNFLPTVPGKIEFINPTIVGIHNMYKGPPQIVHPREVASRYARENIIPPMMSIYMPGKPTQSGSDFLDQVRSEWAQWVSKCSVVIVIGVRPLLAEGHVWDPIVESDAEVWYVGSESGDFLALRERLSSRLVRVGKRFGLSMDPLFLKLGALR